MLFENPVEYMENPYGYYQVNVLDVYGRRMAEYKVRGPLAKAQARIRSVLGRAGLKYINQRTHINVYVSQ